MTDSFPTFVPASNSGPTTEPRAPLALDAGRRLQQPAAVTQADSLPRHPAPPFPLRFLLFCRTRQSLCPTRVRAADHLLQ